MNEQQIRPMVTLVIVGQRTASVAGLQVALEPL